MEQTTTLVCHNCGKSFERPSERLKHDRWRNQQHDFCSVACCRTFRDHAVELCCIQCHRTFSRKKFAITSNRRSKHTKSDNIFCSKSCAATYNNLHKTTGTRRSKLEVWLEEQLRQLYPNLEILFNAKEAINAELDIYFPSLALAFELNGIYHYEPIHGSKKLASIQTNDHRKFAACAEKDIALCVIDVSTMTYFKPAKGQSYLDIIVSIIAAKIRLCSEA